MSKFKDFLRKVFGTAEQEQEDTIIIWEESEPITEPEVIVKPKTIVSNPIVSEVPVVKRPAKRKHHTHKAKVVSNTTKTEAQKKEPKK